ncbi:MAG: hypothetical protein A2Z34_07820 [Planctomycetes bacterium RBG_16_59_8]|nr:MAG: hypothetical protein A2Z34_07820 [Planctomycetes bacterium RBG_16_59_8]
MIVRTALVLVCLGISSLVAVAQEERKIDAETRERILKKVDALLAEHKAQIKKEVDKIIEAELSGAKKSPEKKAAAPASKPAGKPWLGVTITVSDDEKVLSITGVVAGSPAEKAGLKAGDILVEVNGKAIDGDQAFAEAVLKTKPGDCLKICVKRGESRETVEVTLGTRPE